VKASRTEGLRRTERGWTEVAARDPRSYDLPDFRTLSDGRTRRSSWRSWRGRETASAAGASRSSTPATAAVLFASGDESSRWTGPRGR
jgi:hypothetical protein